MIDEGWDLRVRVRWAIVQLEMKAGKEWQRRGESERYGRLMASLERLERFLWRLP